MPGDGGSSPLSQAESVHRQSNLPINLTAEVISLPTEVSNFVTRVINLSTEVFSLLAEAANPLNRLLVSEGKAFNSMSTLAPPCGAVRDVTRRSCPVFLQQATSFDRNQ